MEYNTKYDIEDSVWVMNSNYARQCNIENIHFHNYLDASMNEIHSVKYDVHFLDGRNAYNVSENDLYLTKEDLIASL